MFEINLVRDRIFPAGRRRLAFLMVSSYVLLWGMTVMIAASLYIADLQMMRTCRRDLARIEEEIGADLASTPTQEELVRLRDRLLPRLTGARSIVRGRILWSPKMKEISAHMPEGARLSRLSVEEEGGRSLILEGRLLGKRGGEERVVERLVSGLAENAAFMEGIREIVRSEEGASFRVACRLEREKGM